jgi:enoyl-CoA hydratase
MSTVREHDRAGGVRVLTLDRPPANAEDGTLLTDLSAALDRAADPSVRAVVLTGNGKFFCGGMDLTAAVGADGKVSAMGPVFRDVHLKLLTLPKPVIAMLNGHAIAGGVILVLACDYRLGVEGEYKIGLNEVVIGASFPKVAFEIVRLRLSHQRASEMMLGGALYPASQALRLGIVDELFPADKFEDTVMRRAERMAAFAPDAYAHTKLALVRETVERTLAETDEEAARTAAVWLSPESQAARARQLQKIGK